MGVRQPGRQFQARHRQGLRHQGRRPDRAETPAQGAGIRGPSGTPPSPLSGRRGAASGHRVGAAGPRRLGRPVRAAAGMVGHRADAAHPLCPPQGRSGAGAGRPLSGPPDPGRGRGSPVSGPPDPPHHGAGEPHHRHLPQGQRGRTHPAHRQGPGQGMARPRRRDAGCPERRVGPGRTDRPPPPHGPAAGPRDRTAWRPLGPARGQPDRHPPARHSRRIPPKGHRRGRGRDARAPQGPRRPAPAAVGDHRPLGCARPRRRRRGLRGGGWRRDHLGRHRRCRPLRPPRFRAGPRGVESWQLDLFPRSRGADAARGAVGGPLFAARGRGPRRHRGRDAPGRTGQQDRPPLSSRRDEQPRQPGL